MCTFTSRMNFPPLIFAVTYNKNNESLFNTYTKVPNESTSYFVKDTYGKFPAKRHALNSVDQFINCTVSCDDIWSKRKHEIKLY